MAITAAGLYGLTYEKLHLDTFGASFESETLLSALMVEDGYTPNYDTHDFRADLTNEVSGTGYTTGGTGVTTTEITLSSGVLKFDHDDVSWGTSTILNAMALVGYLEVGSSATDMLIYLLDFVTAASSGGGTFLVTINASGVYTWDYTPA